MTLNKIMYKKWGSFKQHKTKSKCYACRQLRKVKFIPGLAQYEAWPGRPIPIVYCWSCYKRTWGRESAFDTNRIKYD